MFTEYIQPSLKNQYEQMEQKILHSIEKRNSQTFQAPINKALQDINNEQQDFNNEDSNQRYNEATEEMFEEMPLMSNVSNEEEMGNNMNHYL